MTRPVRWSRDALDDLKRQVAYLKADNPAAARRLADRIRDTASALGEMAVGRPGRVSGSYEKVVVGWPCVVAYAIVDEGGRETVSILRIIHTSRNWNAEEWPD